MGDTNSGESLRNGVANASMEVMEAVDDDFAPMLETYTEHVMLMIRELERRGLEKVHAIQIITSYTVAAAIECP